MDNVAERLLDYRSDLGLSFIDCLRETANTPELLQEFCRLSGLANPLTASGINKMIDEATGYDRMVIDKFVDFVWECVWKTIPVLGSANG